MGVGGGGLEMHTKVYSENLKVSDHLYPARKWDDNIKMNLKEIDC
jgi:hypothetical protein